MTGHGGRVVQVRDYDIDHSKLEIISHYSNNRALSGLWPLTISNRLRAISHPKMCSSFALYDFAIPPPSIRAQFGGKYNPQKSISTSFWVCAASESWSKYTTSTSARCRYIPEEQHDNIFFLWHFS